MVAEYGGLWLKLVAALFSLIAVTVSCLLYANHCLECLCVLLSLPALRDDQHHAGELGQLAAAA